MFIYSHTNGEVLTELVLLRFQQSGLRRFCSSARALASMVYILLSSFFIFFHLSPRITLMALWVKGQMSPVRGVAEKNLFPLQCNLLICP